MCSSLITITIQFSACFKMYLMHLILLCFLEFVLQLRPELRCPIFPAVLLKLLWTSDPSDPLWYREKASSTTTKHWPWQRWNHARVHHCWAACNPALTWHNLDHSPRETHESKEHKHMPANVCMVGASSCTSYSTVKNTMTCYWQATENHRRQSKTVTSHLLLKRSPRKQTICNLKSSFNNMDQDPAPGAPRNMKELQYNYHINYSTEHTVVQHQQNVKRKSWQYSEFYLYSISHIATHPSKHQWYIYANFDVSAHFDDWIYCKNKKNSKEIKWFHKRMQCVEFCLCMWLC